MSQIYDKLEVCMKSIRKQTDFKPETALILGSGLGDYADEIRIEQTVAYTEIEGFPVSTVAGHKGRFVFGYVKETPVVIMQGRVADELGVRFPDMSEVYSLRMRGIIKQEAAKLGIGLREGVYVQLTGPAYETPAEVRMCRGWGGDAVGMSTACEAMAARHMGTEVCGISCITNLAAGLSSAQLDHKEVQETADRVAGQFKALVTAVVCSI